MKKILALLIAMALVTALLAGCGDDHQTSSQENGDTSTTQGLTDEALGNIFKEASEIGDATAGVSLKRANLAAKIASYAAVMNYTTEAEKSLREEMKSKYNALDDQGKENLDISFEAAFNMLDTAIIDGDYDSVKGLFEDAGSAENIQTILKTPGLRDSYSTFKSAYLSMGNSDK